MSDHKDLYLVCENKCLVEYSVDLVYPVGSIYLSVNNTSPALLFGGTWEQIKDVFLLAAGDSYAAGETGGEALHALMENEMPSHRHYPVYIGSDNMNIVKWTSSGGGDTQWAIGYGQETSENMLYTGYSGNNVPHNNMPPYLTVYTWKRVA